MYGGVGGEGRADCFSSRWREIWFVNTETLRVRRFAYDGCTTPNQTKEQLRAPASDGGACASDEDRTRKIVRIVNISAMSCWPVRKNPLPGENQRALHAHALIRFVPGCSNFPMLLRRPVLHLLPSHKHSGVRSDSAITMSGQLGLQKLNHGAGWGCTIAHTFRLQ
jgi:hypothetical protein